jgi:hypothetical protein
MKHTICLLFLLTTSAAAQLWIPEGTPVRVRLEENLLRDARAVDGQQVEFSVVEQVWAQQRVAIAVGAPAMGKLVLVQGKASSKPVLEVAIERVRAMDGSWLPLRYAAQKEAPARLVRADFQITQRVDPKILLPRGAMFALYVDKPATAKAATGAQQEVEESLYSLFMRGGLNSETIWPHRYSLGLYLAGFLLIALGVFYRWKQNRALQSALMARMASSDNWNGWQHPYRRQTSPSSQTGSIY